MVIEGNIAKIILRDKAQEIVGEAVVDAEDLPRCLEYKWHIRKNKNTNYAIATLSQTEKLHLHRLILNYTGPLDIDHINRNGLDNRLALSPPAVAIAGGYCTLIYPIQ